MTAPNPISAARTIRRAIREIDPSAHDYANRINALVKVQCGGMGRGDLLRTLTLIVGLLARTTDSLRQADESLERLAGLPE